MDVNPFVRENQQTTYGLNTRNSPYPDLPETSRKALAQGFTVYDVNNHARPNYDQPDRSLHPPSSDLTSELTRKVVHNLGEDLFDHCPLDHVTKAGRSFNYDTSGYLQRRLRGSLKPWFEDPQDLLEALRTTDAVISGSFVLRFILGTAAWRPGNLNLYVRTGRSANELKDFVTAQGFVLNEAVDNPSFDADLSDVVTVTLYKKYVRHDHCTVYLDITETPACRSFSPIFRFHLTCVMNFITDNCIYILYPALTFSMRAIIHPRENRGDILNRRCVIKYRERGFTVIRSVEDLGSDCGNACPGLWRTVADIGCLACVLHEESSDGLAETNNMENMTWALTVDGDMPIARCPNPKCVRTPLMYLRRDGAMPITPFSDDTLLPNINLMNVHLPDLLVNSPQPHVTIHPTGVDNEDEDDILPPLMPLSPL